MIYAIMNNEPKETKDVHMHLNPDRKEREKRIWYNLHDDFS